MNYFLLIVVTLFLNNFYVFFLESSDHVVNLVFDVCQYLLFIFLFCFIFVTSPRKSFKLRGASLLLCFMYVNLTISTIYDKMDICLYYIQYPLGVFLFSYFLYTFLNWKDLPSERIINNKSYFVFKRPESFLDFIITIFRTPVSSFGIISDGKWYKFSRNVEGLFVADKVKLDNSYYAVQVDKIDTVLLDSLVGIPWKMYKSNCITAFLPVFNSLGMELGKLDFIPSIFAYKFLKGRYGKV